MKISSIESILAGAEKNHQALWQYILQSEFQDSGTPIEEIVARVEKTYTVMRNAVRAGLKENGRSLSGLTGGDAYKYYSRIETGRTLLSDFNAKAIAYAIATNEYNASMGVIVAAPTAGASGIMPGVLIAAQEEFGYMDSDIVHSLIVASGIGAVIADFAVVVGKVLAPKVIATVVGICLGFSGIIWYKRQTKKWAKEARRRAAAQAAARVSK